MFAASVELPHNILTALQIKTEKLHGVFLFVKACSIFSKKIVSHTDVITADLLLLNFCRNYEKLYGPETFATI